MLKLKLVSIAIIEDNGLNNWQARIASAFIVAVKGNRRFDQVGSPQRRGLGSGGPHSSWIETIIGKRQENKSYEHKHHQLKLIGTTQKNSHDM